MTESLYTITKTMNLTLKETLVFTVIAWNSSKCKDSTNDRESRISREMISAFSGIKDVKSITKHTNALEEKGLLRKINHYEKEDGVLINKVLYRINGEMLQEDYVHCYNSIFSLPSDVIPFLIKLAPLRYTASSEIRMTDKAIREKTGLKEDTFRKLKKAALATDALMETEQGYSLSSKYFKVFSSWHLSDADLREIQMFRKPVLDLIAAEKAAAEADKKKKRKFSYNEFFQKHTELKPFLIFEYYWRRNFEGIKSTPMNLLRWCQTGCRKTKSFKWVESVTFEL